MSTASILAIAAVLLLTIAVPLSVMLFLRRRGGAWTAFLTGAGTFVLFAMILEPVLHRLVLGSPLGPALQGNIWLYGLYGGLAAGVFEEAGRLLAFRFVLKGRWEPVTSLAYGIGHGGGEAFLLAGLAMLSNLALGLAYAGGGDIPAELVPAVEALLAVPSGVFLWSGFERLTAMALHMALSVLVFASLRTERRRLFPAAILLHAAVDFNADTTNAFLPIAATETLVLAVTLVIAAWAASIYKKLPEIAKTP